ncbi:putative ABC transporter permease [Butyrivibrio sp. XPD2006]|uniref:putative ABC transporter permease n=1 Tax=Butyrivibrio sp. XPD2006 TaxID=1280668 RepID=UPI0003B78EC4|nr:putative ABC transporter permease [Butyrivibrio sp. XPD2006]
MFNYQPMQWLFLFFFYSFFGWIFETIYVSVHEGHFVNRGFIRGPFLPLYGCGGIMMLLASKPFYENIVLVFISGCIGATALEYITAVVMEALFKVRYWDYSHKKIHFQGRISLESTLAWGLCTVVFTHWLQIPIERIVLSIPYNIVTVATTIVVVMFSADFMLAFKTALDLKDVLIYMEKAKSEMARMQKRLDVIIAFKGEDVRESIGDKIDGIGDKIGGIGSTVGNTVGAIGSGISVRLDSLSDSLENSFKTIRDKINLDPAAYVGNAREEVLELYAKYRVIMARFTPGPVKNFFVWYRERTIEGNPTMSSESYKGNLEEVKEKVKKRRKK